jgi:hypothetical protein
MKLKAVMGPENLNELLEKSENAENICLINFTRKARNESAFGIVFSGRWLAICSSTVNTQMLSLLNLLLKKTRFMLKTGTGHMEALV